MAVVAVSIGAIFNCDRANAQLQPGACCLPSGVCTLTSDQFACAAQAGVFLARELSCAGVSCTGACCEPGGQCTLGSSQLCASSGGEFSGFGSTCASAVCGGACCARDGTCTTTNVSSCASPSTFNGLGTTCADVECTAYCTGEHEDDCGLPSDTTNGGCNTDPLMLTILSCQETVCGTVGATNDTRDTDWYSIDVDAPVRLTWSVQPAFPALSGFVEMDFLHVGSPSCANATGAVNPYALIPTGEMQSVSACVPAGQHWLLVAPQSTGDPIACGSVGYEATIECTPLPPGDIQCDGAVTRDDWLYFVISQIYPPCFLGPGGGTYYPCSLADSDGDGDVDLSDVARYLVALEQ